MAEQASAHSFGRYAATIARQWKVIAAGVVFGVLLATGYLVVAGQNHTARTDVNINVISTNPFSTQQSAAGLLDGITEAQIATSHAVATRVTEQLGLSASGLRDRLEASVIPDATVIRIEFAADSAKQAREGADAIADAYLAYRSEQAGARLEGILNRLNTRVDELRAQLVDANTRLSAAEPGSPEANQSISDRDLITIELDNLLAQKTATESIDTSGGSVLTSATENAVTVSPSLTLLLGTGLLAGLALGVLVAFVINGFRHRVRDSEDAAIATGIRVLVELPAGGARIPENGIALDRIRVARERIQASFDPVGRVIAVLDDAPGDGMPETAINLALAFAETGQSTRLILPAAPADSTSLVGNGHPLEIIVPAAREGDAAHLMTDEVRSLLAERPPRTVTLIALPASSDVSSRIAAARIADAFVLVLTVDLSRKDLITEEVEELLEVGGTLLGAIVVPKSRRLAQVEVGTIEEPAVARSTRATATGTTAKPRASRSGSTGTRKKPAGAGQTVATADVASPSSVREQGDDEN